MKTPVALMCFNRPAQTQRVFERIRQARPPKLYLFADGPRHEQEALRVQQVRQVIERVDWPCEVIRDYASENLGIIKRFLTAKNLLFEQEPAAICLEDDTLPHLDFFRFAEAMLERYRDDENILYINGTNNLWGRFPSSDSYFFSRYLLPWGWASWRRVWQSYDFSCSAWLTPEGRQTVLNAIPEGLARSFWMDKFDTHIPNPGHDFSYDHAFQFLIFLQHGWTVMPNRNLVCNIGFGATATHTVHINKSHIIPTHPLKWPLAIHQAIAKHPQRDDWIFRVHALYEEARPLHRWWNATRIRLGAWRRKLF